MYDEGYEPTNELYSDYGPGLGEVYDQMYDDMEKLERLSTPEEFREWKQEIVLMLRKEDTPEDIRKRLQTYIEMKTPRIIGHTHCLKYNMLFHTTDYQVNKPGTVPITCEGLECSK